MKEDQLDVLIKKTVKENADKIQGLNDIPITPLDEILGRVEEGLKLKTEQKTKRFQLKYVAVIVCILLTSSLISIYIAPTSVQGFVQQVTEFFIEMKDNLKIIRYQEQDETPPPPSPEVLDEDSTIQILTLEQAKKMPELKLIWPEYIPEGYTFDKIEVKWYHPDESKIIRQDYRSDGEILTIMQYTNVEKENTTDIFDKDSSICEIDIMGEGGLLASIGNSHVIIWYKNDVRYEISGNLQEKELNKLVRSIKTNSD